MIPQEEPEIQRLGLADEPPVANIVAPVGELQFAKADFGTDKPKLKCRACQADIEEIYYQLDGADICAQCQEKAAAAREIPRASHLLKAGWFGFGGALAGAAAYAAVEMATGYTIGFVAILAGWLVGKAVRSGAGGLGGRRLQVLAVALTWFSITMGYVPSIIKSALDEGKREENNKKSGSAAKSVDKQEGKAAQAAPDAVKEPLPNPALALAMFFGLILVSPFLILFNGIGGIINALIMFWGLQQAWTMTAADARAITGPYSVKAEPA